MCHLHNYVQLRISFDGKHVKFQMFICNKCSRIITISLQIKYDNDYLQFPLVGNMLTLLCFRSSKFLCIITVA